MKSTVTSNKRVTTIAVLQRIFRLLTHEDRQWLAAGCLVALISALCSLALLAIAGHFITAMAWVGMGGAAINYYTPAALIRLLAVLRTGGRYVERLATHEATLRLLARLRNEIFTCLIPLSPHQLHAFRSVELFSRLRADVDALEHAYLGVFVPVTVACGAAVFVMVVAACYLPLFAGALLCLLVASGVVLPIGLQQRSAPAAQAITTTTEALRVLAVDGFQGNAELTLYGRQALHAQTLQRVAHERREAHRRLDSLQTWGGAAILLATYLCVTLALIFGILALHHGGSGPGSLDGPDLAMLTMLAMAAFDTLVPLPHALTQWGTTRHCAERIFALVDMRPAMIDPMQPASAPTPARAALSIRQLRMRYGSEGRWVLRGVDLDVPVGRRIALLGASGAGKSSLVAALLRLHPYEGTILLDGKPLDAYRVEDVRACFAVVEQHPYLFDASLRDNLCLARPYPTPAQLTHAIEVAQLTSFVAALPQGLDTFVGENGMRVSGGEIRRIAIARALLVDAPVLILDEPTEGLDPRTAHALLHALKKETAGRTVLLITHHARYAQQLAEYVFEMAHGQLLKPPACFAELREIAAAEKR